MIVEMTGIVTRFGEAQLTEHRAGAGAGAEAEAEPLGTALVLHGAGTSTATPLLLCLCDALAQAGVRAVRLDQPYALGARRPPAPAAQLDAVVRSVLISLEGPIVILGRSSGARVACRVSADRCDEVKLRGIVALAFPLRPPGRPNLSRAGELAAAMVPVHVVQGSRDPFGAAADVAALGVPGVSVHEVMGADHGFAVRRRDGRTEEDVFAEVCGVVLPVVLGWMGQETGT